MGKKGGPNEDGVASHISGQANKPMSAPAHALSYEDVARQLGADVQNGLSNEEHKKRLEEFGRNEFGETASVQPIRIFIGQIANSLTLVGCAPIQCGLSFSLQIKVESFFMADCLVVLHGCLLMAHPIFGGPFPCLTEDHLGTKKTLFSSLNLETIEQSRCKC